MEARAMNIKVEHHGNPNGLSWFVTAAGIEAGPFTQVEAVAEVAKIMARMGDLAKPVRPAWLYAQSCPNGQACTVHPRPADTYLRSAEERAWVRQHGMLAWGRPGDSVSVDRDYAEMRRITGTADGDPVPAWY
jgi:hypothetical protein